MVTWRSARSLGDYLNPLLYLRGADCPSNSFRVVQAAGASSQVSHLLLSPLPGMQNKSVILGLCILGWLYSGLFGTSVVLRAQVCHTSLERLQREMVAVGGEKSASVSRKDRVHAASHPSYQAYSVELVSIKGRRFHASLVQP